MSIHVMNDVWKHSRAEGGARLLLLCIADHCKDDGEGAWPSVARLADRTKQSVRTTQRLLRVLQRLGELQIHQKAGPRQCNSYAVTLQGGDISGTGGDNLGTGVVTNQVQGGDTAMSPDPSGSIRRDPPRTLSGKPDDGVKNAGEEAFKVFQAMKAKLFAAH